MHGRVDRCVREWRHAQRAPITPYPPTHPPHSSNRRGPESFRGRGRARQRRAPAAKRLPLPDARGLRHDYGGRGRLGANCGAGEPYVGRGYGSGRRPGLRLRGGHPGQDGWRGRQRADLRLPGPGGRLQLPWGGRHVNRGGAVCPYHHHPGPERLGVDVVQRGRVHVAHLRAQLCPGRRPRAKDFGCRGAWPRCRRGGGGWFALFGYLYPSIQSMSSLFLFSPATPFTL